MNAEQAPLGAAAGVDTIINRAQMLAEVSSKPEPYRAIPLTSEFSYSATPSRRRPAPKPRISPSGWISTVAGVWRPET